MRVQREGGYFLIDCMLGILVIGIGAAGFFMTMPVVSHSQILSRHQVQASEMASRMAEQLQSINASGLTYSNLETVGLIDTASPAASPFTFSSIPLDNATQYSPSTALPSGTGSLALTTLASGAMMATISISWTETTGPRTYTTATIIGSYR